MTFAAPTVKNSRLKSTWTPLTNEESNKKLFEERRSLVKKWFEKWTDEQRATVLNDLVSQSKLKQLEFTASIVSKRVPVYSKDFTAVLPRVISLYIFSFLDPRSLCRACRVSWHWKNIAETDQIWMPKCLRLNWMLSFTPSPYEIGVWKRNYVERIKVLRFPRPRNPPVRQVSLDAVDQPDDVNGTKTETKSQKTHQKHHSKTPSKKQHSQPWKGSCPTPTDIVRYNYLENDDEVEKIKKLRKKGIYGPTSDEISQNAKSKINTGKAQLKDRRALSMTKLNKINNDTNKETYHHTEVTDSEGRPLWATRTTGAPFVNAEVTTRPPSMYQQKQKLLRTDREPPSTELFPEKPWVIRNEEERFSDG